MTVDGMVERSPVAAPDARASGSTCGWQDRASDAAPAPGALHPSVPEESLAGVAVVPLRPSRAGLGAAAGSIERAPDGSEATLIGTGAAGVIVVPAGRRPAVPNAAWARWTASVQAVLHRADAAIACRWDAVWPDAASIVAWLRTRSTALAEEFAAIRGAVELVLHLPPPTEATTVEAAALPEPTGPGGRWLLERVRERGTDATTRAERALDGPLAALAGHTRRAVPAAMGDEAVVRLLVDGAAVESVRQQADALRTAGVIGRVGGPWVPAPGGGALAA